jgi:hypothetical protein
MAGERHGMCELAFTVTSVRGAAASDISVGTGLLLERTAGCRCQYQLQVNAVLLVSTTLAV